MGYVYKVGDIFVSNTLGVVTILEVKESIYNKTYKCKVYDKQKVQDRIEYLNDATFNNWRTYNMYKFYPVVK